MKRLITLATCILLLVGCQHQTQPEEVGEEEKVEAASKPEIPNKKKLLKQILLETFSDKKVPKTTADNWKDGWSVYEAVQKGETTVDIGPGTWRTARFKKHNINALKEHGVVGLRVYFALENPINPGEAIEKFHFFLVGVDADTNDVYRDTIAPMLKNGQSKGVWRSKAIAEAQIAHWNNYMDSLDETYIKVNAYTYDWTYVEQELVEADSNKLFFSPAMRTVYMPGASGYNAPVLSSNPCNDNLLGFQVIDMVMEGNNTATTGDCGEVVNFANPCPIYCGQQNLLPPSVQ